MRDESADSTIVETAGGRVQGCVAEGISVFRGIPYGAPTGGANRFRPPQPPEPWTGVRTVRVFGETAPQSRSWLSVGGWKGNRPSIGEDCLRLNVFTPGTDAARRPVMVWLHGGGFEAGTGSMMLYDGVNVCRRGDVVVVSINHRLGLFGHLWLDGIEGLGGVGEDFAGSANAGFLDIVAALRWVRANIDGFGGDPGNVTIYGQSGGGRKVSLAMASAAAHGLFHRGIVQSGSHLRLLTSERASELTARLLAELDVAPANVRAIQDLPMERLVDANRAIISATRRRFSPAVDGVVFHEHPWDPAAPTLSADLPMIVGTCRTELSNQLGTTDPTTFETTDAELPERLARFVPSADVADVIAAFRGSNPAASAPELLFTIATARGYWLDSLLQTERKVVQGGAPVYSYRLMWRTPVEDGRRITPHSLDLPFVFDNVDAAGDMVGPPTEDTARLTDSMCDAWLAFARTGDPNHAGLLEWRPYDLEQRPVMHFDVESSLVDDPHRDERLAITRYPTQQVDKAAHHR